MRVVLLISLIRWPHQWAPTSGSVLHQNHPPAPLMIPTQPHLPVSAQTCPAATATAMQLRWGDVWGHHRLLFWRISVYSDWDSAYRGRVRADEHHRRRLLQYFWIYQHVGHLWAVQWLRPLWHSVFQQQRDFCGTLLIHRVLMARTVALLMMDLLWKNRVLVFILPHSLLKTSIVLWPQKPRQTMGLELKFMKRLSIMVNISLDFINQTLGNYICCINGKCKKDVTPLLTHWSYAFLALTHRYRPVWWCINLIVSSLIMGQFETYLITKKWIWSCCLKTLKLICIVWSGCNDWKNSITH